VNSPPCVDDCMAGDHGLQRLVCVDGRVYNKYVISVSRNSQQ